jgi:hypothetical protein
VTYPRVSQKVLKNLDLVKSFSNQIKSNKKEGQLEGQLKVQLEGQLEVLL